MKMEKTNAKEDIPFDPWGNWWPWPLAEYMQNSPELSAIFNGDLAIVMVEEMAEATS